MQVVVDSLLTQYDRAGKGKTVLVLHGWADNSKGWQKVAAQLAKKFDVIIVDLPGFGSTQAPSTAWGLDEYAAFVGSFLKKIHTQAFAIVGHSNGGAIAIRGLANRAFAAERLVLLDSAGVRREYSTRKKAVKLVTKTGKLLTKPLPSNVKKQLRRKLYQHVGSDMLLVEHLQEIFKKVVTDDVQKDAARLKLPTLLVYGADDLDTPVQHGRMLHNLIAGSGFEVVPGAGHFAHLDKPAVVLPLVEEFLQR